MLGDDRAAVSGPSVLVTGADGQLGRAFIAALPPEWQAVGLARTDLDITDSGEVARVTDALKPLAIINCASYNDVDGAEQAAEQALAVNAMAVRGLARAAAACGAILVHYSTDFVFDGEASHPYREGDAVGPRSVYAASKLVGEWFAADAPAHYVLRVESLFGGARRTSSFDRIVATIVGGGTVRVFVDRVVSPSYVWDVVAATVALLRTRPAYGLYHCVNTGAATWAALAEHVRDLVGSSATLEPIRLADLSLKAARPRYCALANEKLRAAGVAMPTWQDAVARYLTEVRAGEGTRPD